MDPLSAALLIGSSVITAFETKKAADSQAFAQRRAMKEAREDAISNRNALVEQQFNKRRQARGLGQGAAQTGGLASQSGSVLTSVTGGANSLV